MQLPHLSVCVSVFRISEKRADPFPWNFSCFIGVIRRLKRKQISGEFRPSMCTNSENGVKWPTLRKSALAIERRRAQLSASSQARLRAGRWWTAARANDARSWGRGPDRNLWCGTILNEGAEDRGADSTERCGAGRLSEG